MNAQEFMKRCGIFAEENNLTIGQGSGPVNPEDQYVLVEFNRNNDYFISISWDDREEKPYQVFEAYIGWGPELQADTELWEYGDYKNLGNALNNALTNSKDGRKPKRVWN